MDWKKIGKLLLFPPNMVVFILLPASTVALVCGFLHFEEASPVRIASYAASFYTLAICCARAPKLVGAVQNWKNKNPYTQIWMRDVRLRVKVNLISNVIWNSAYGALQLGLGIYHRSFWFCSLAGYYFSLALMRIFLAGHIIRHRPGEKMRRELSRHRSCGWIFLLTNLTLSAMVFFMIRENRSVTHHEITTIALAAYTFTSLTMAIINAVRYRRYHSPIISASRAISLAAACVSMLTLENTMLATFSDGSMHPQLQKQFLYISGGVLSLFIVVMALSMIVRANRDLKNWEEEHGAQRKL